MKILFLILSVLICTISFAQNKIPRCFGTDTGYWNECVGSYTLPDGSRYVGMWRDGDYNGRGTQTFTNGNKYEGEFKNGKRNGIGKYSFSNKDIYIGEFKNGKRNGSGTYHVHMGSKYINRFEDDNPIGEGVEITSTGKERRGRWIDNVFIAVLEHPKNTNLVGSSELLENAKSGDAEAQYQYGMKFIIGTNDPIKPRLAVEWLMKAAAQGHISAKSQIESMFDFGIRMTTFESSIKTVD